GHRDGRVARYLEGVRRSPLDAGDPGRPRRPRAAVRAARATERSAHPAPAHPVATPHWRGLHSTTRSRIISAVAVADNVCLITGVGPGPGSALARRFAAGGYRVAMLARSAARLAALEAELPGSRAFACDVSDAEMLARVLDDVRRDLGHPKVVVHNAVAGSFGTFLDVDPTILEQNFRVNVLSLLHLARGLLPDMI